MIVNKKLFGSVAVALAVAAYPLFASEVEQTNPEAAQVVEEVAAPVAEEAAPIAEEAAPVAEKADCENCSCN